MFMIIIAIMSVLSVLVSASPPGPDFLPGSRLWTHLHVGSGAEPVSTSFRYHSHIDPNALDPHISGTP